MKIGKRTQVYFVGFLIGIAIVSILVDSRRDRSEDNPEEVLRWNHLDAAMSDLPEEVVARVGEGSYLTALQEANGVGVLTGRRAYFIAAENKVHFWWMGEVGAMDLYRGDQLKVISQRGHTYELMKAGLAHQGHSVVSGEEMIPEYIVQIEVYSAQDMMDAVENLKDKSFYIASVDWVEVDE